MREGTAASHRPWPDFSSHQTLELQPARTAVDTMVVAWSVETAMSDQGPTICDTPTDHEGQNRTPFVKISVKICNRIEKRWEAGGAASPVREHTWKLIRIRPDNPMMFVLPSGLLARYGRC